MYLASIPADPGGLDLTAATALNLQDVPNFVDAGMGDMKDLPPKYSEGKLVQ